MRQQYCLLAGSLWCHHMRAPIFPDVFVEIRALGRKPVEFSMIVPSEVGGAGGLKSTQPASVFGERALRWTNVNSQEISTPPK